MENKKNRAVGIRITAEQREALSQMAEMNPLNTRKSMSFEVEQAIAAYIEDGINNPIFQDRIQKEIERLRALLKPAANKEEAKRAGLD